MKERIYTIPVNEAFDKGGECPICTLEVKLEKEYIDYFLGPSLMEPDHRIETNDKGFCRRHFEQLYNRQENRLGLGLILDTHLQQQNRRLKQIYEEKYRAVQKDAETPALKSLPGKLSGRQTETEKLVGLLISELSGLEEGCSVCGRLEHTMDRYIDVILYLWFKENEFRDKFNRSKGFCLKHFRQLLEGVSEYLNPREKAIFTGNLMQLQLKNLERIQQEVSWFTKKFDYRNTDAPWGNSKDALPRSIKKIAGPCDFK